MEVEKKRRTQRDRVLNQRRGLNEEEVALVAVVRKDNQHLDMDKDASEMASKRQDLEKVRKTKRHGILAEKRNMENLKKSDSAKSANEELQRAMLNIMRKLGALVPETRRMKKYTILNERRNIISAELKMEEDLQITSRRVPFSRSNSQETVNLQRAAAQKRLRNNRDWVVQCRRRLIDATPIGNGENLGKITIKRNEILTEERQIENLKKSSSAKSADKKVHRTMLKTMRKLGALVPETRRKNTYTVLDEQKNIIGTEIELEEVQQITSRRVPISRSNSQETVNLQRAAAQKRLRNNRDWVVQCRRCLIDATPIGNGNGENLGKIINRNEILTEERQIGNLKKSSSAKSADKKVHRTMLKTMRKLGALVPETRRKNTYTVLDEQKNIISTEIELEEVHQVTSRRVSISRSNSQETVNLQRVAAQKRLRNNRDWVVQCRRRLNYATPLGNGNSALTLSPINICFIESQSLEKDPPAYGNVSPFSDMVDIEDLDYACSRNPSWDMSFSHTPSPDEMVQDLDYACSRNPSCDMVVSHSPSLEEMIQDLGYACSRKPSCDMALSHTPSPKEMVNATRPIDINMLQYENELGEGASGRVFLASNPSTEELMAVKIITKPYDEEQLSYELEILEMAADNRFLISLRAFMETPTECYIAMDYMPGGDLCDLMSQLMPFDYQITRFFAAEIICGVQYLHEQGVVHRDLKPENILVDKIGHIKIADFGAAAINVFGEDTMEDFVGTIGYIAPEIMNGEPYNHLVDSFAFGVILYTMTMGKEPFYGQGSKSDYHQSLQEDVPLFTPEMCPGAINIIEGLLCKNPCGRLAISSSIRCHPFFHSVDWGNVESGRAPPPFN